MLHVMLSLDFANAEEKRADFYKYLESKYWKKQGGVDTVWTCSQQLMTQINSADVLANIADILLAAAKEYKPSTITYVVQIGNSDAISRIVKKVNGSYGVYSL
ncbi:hypothetical protein [Pseudomonas syringae]|uniref:hypothetical protein n=1 Tax=Pseudomonas syringae TaxID=317 RepID=UPI0006CB10C4|nr:hypothetical protein [Pseudomonas syringae]ALE01050.1 hypothetical protein PSYRMG_25305 [Pseudomonas syringae UMAF0158]MCK9731916.1 hypothetical protein [Pseudomonas syringae pv. syringae]